MFLYTIAHTAARRCKEATMKHNKYGGYADCKVDKRVYGLWYQMLRRCYDEEQQKRVQGRTYKECFVCERWMVLSNFAKDIKRLEGYEKMARHARLLP